MVYSDYLQRLLKAETNIWVDIYFRFDLNRAESAIIATTPMQRLRRLRQTGLGYFDNVCAEHSRLPHSIGTVYWAVRLVDGLLSANNSDSVENLRTLASVRASLNDLGLAFDLLVRVFALVHDVALMPLGHTMRFQLNQLHDETTFRTAMHHQLSQIVAEIDSDRHRLDATERQALKRHLAYAGCVANVPRLLRGEMVRFVEDVDGAALVTNKGEDAIPALSTIYDIVHGVYSADLIEICVRDLAAAGTTWRMPRGVIEAGRLFRVDKGMAAFPAGDASPVSSVWRYGIGRGKPGRETDAIRDLAMVHMTRLEIAARSFYGPRKCMADAMLDKAIRLLLDAERDVLSHAPFSGKNRLTIGDDEFLNLLLDTAKSQQNADAERILRLLGSGLLFEAVIQYVGSTDVQIVQKLGQASETPEQRSWLERALVDRLPQIEAAQIIVISTPERMQSKVADTPVLDSNNEWRPFNDVCRDEAIHPEIVALPSAYRRLRRAGVYISPDVKIDLPSLRCEVVEALVDIGLLDRQPGSQSSL